MSTTAGIQALLDPNSTAKSVKILRESTDAGNVQYYATGGATYPGKARWTSVDPAQSDVTNAIAISTSLAL